MLMRGLRFYDTYVHCTCFVNQWLLLYLSWAGTLCLFSNFYKYVHGAEVKVSAVKDAWSLSSTSQMVLRKG